MLQSEARLAGAGQHRGPDRADDAQPCRRDRLIWHGIPFQDCVFQIIVPTLGYLEPRVFIDGIQLVTLPAGRDFPQVPDIVADRRRKRYWLRPALTIMPSAASLRTTRSFMSSKA